MAAAHVVRDYLRRLPDEHYSGRAMVHWTLTVEQQATGWLRSDTHAFWREILVHAAFRFQIAVPIYCLMPDHAHVLMVGMASDTNQLRALSYLRRYSTPMLGAAAWQKQAHDHVLRDAERSSDGFRSIAHYIRENPVRKELVSRAEAWLYCATVIPGMPTLDWRQPDFWPHWWKLFADA